MERRKFVQIGLGLATTSMLSQSLLAKGAEVIAYNKLPKWRGFNLLEKFNSDVNKPFLEWDFKKMAEWGFDFARLPMSYHCWSKPDDWFKIDEAVLKEIDQAIAYGAK
ncbi:MAG: glycoside hydrolase, partial [Pedobacter sp.]